MRVEKRRLNNDLQWTKEDGSKVWVSDMSESHAKNCLLLLMKRVAAHNNIRSIAADDEWYNNTFRRGGG